ncbi:HIT family protein [Aliagarivorans marinus]|uniref:HIT family protein n=1 Tax=Aliagarivorans marinus TaxID=561965 RepID=UPI00041266E5|nr:HIT family protein [Aliagarivorans marinus]
MTIVEKIVARELDALIVYESNDVIAFADHDPINSGHILIAPTQCYESFIDLPIAIHDEIQQVARDLYQRITAKFNPQGITFIQNNGKFNDLGHYHLHIFPRFDGDRFGWTSNEHGLQSPDMLREKLAGL